MEPIRLARKVPEGSRPPIGNRCREPGCDTFTKENKGYCPGHVLSGSYAARLVQANQSLEAERRRLERTGRIDPAGCLANEIRLAIIAEPSINRITRATSISVRAAKRAVRVLPFVEVIGRNKRGTWILRLKRWAM